MHGFTMICDRLLNHYLAYVHGWMLERGAGWDDGMWFARWHRA